MKKIILTLIACCSLHGSASAALPPLWQSVAELKAILEDKKLGETLQSGEFITEIHHVESSWLIITNYNKLQIQVIYNEAKMPGPAQFSLEFGQAEKL